MSRSLRISRSRIATFACSKSPSLTQVPANPVAEITRPKPFSARIRTKRSPRCAHIIVPAASFLAISRLQRRAQGRFRCPGSLARLLRGSAKIRAPNQRRPAPTRIESLTPLLLHHQHSSLIPTPASRLPVAKARAKLLRLLQFCAVAAKPVSADPSLFCFPLPPVVSTNSLSFPFPSFPLLNLTGLNSPQDTKRRSRLDRYPQSSSASVSCCSHQLHSHHPPPQRTYLFPLVESPAIRACDSISSSSQSAPPDLIFTSRIM